MLDENLLAAIGDVTVSAAELEHMLAWVGHRIATGQPTYIQNDVMAILSGRPGAMITFKAAVKECGDPELTRLRKEAERLFKERGRIAHSMAFKSPTPDGQDREPYRLFYPKTWAYDDRSADDLRDLAAEFRDLTLAIWKAHQLTFVGSPGASAP
jgi:hypothetical protein